MAKRTSLLGLAWLTIGLWCAGGCGPSNDAAKPAVSDSQADDAQEDDRGLPVIPELDSTGLKVGAYELVDMQGEPFDSGSLDGEVYVVDFFFTACPVQCPKLSQAFERLQNKLGDQGLRLVSISVDPTNDTLEELQRYAEKYNAKPSQWKFLTGKREEIERVAHEVFRVPLQDRLHTEKFILVDRQGEIVGFYNGLDPAKISELEAKATELLTGAGEESPS